MTWLNISKWKVFCSCFDQELPVVPVKQEKVCYVIAHEFTTQTKKLE